MLRKLITIAAMLVSLTILAVPLVLAQQDVGVEYGETVAPVVGPLPSGSGDTDAGFLQYDSQLPPGAYYDCPPPTVPQMGRPCILVIP